MKAVILCGGIGSRLRPLTEVTPKPLVKILNVPILEHIIQKVIQAGITEIYLSLGYKAQDIISFCEQKQFAAEISYYEEEKPLGTAGGVKNCISASEEPVLVLSGDNIFTIDLQKAVTCHNASGAFVTVVGKTVEDPREYGVILKDPANNVISFIEKPTWENAESFVINTGVYILNGEALDMIPTNTEYDFAKQLFPKLLQEQMLFKCYHTDDYWGDIGEFNVYSQVNLELLKNYTDVFVYSGILYTADTRDDSGNRFIAPVLVGTGLKIGKNNTIGPGAVIGERCEIKNDCVIEKSILGNDIVIGSHCEIRSCIADDHVHLGDYCAAEENAVLGYGVSAGNFSRILQNTKIWPGKRISPETVVSGDVFFETPEMIEPDIFGITCSAFTQFTLSDTLRLGQAAASIKEVRRVGFGTDGSKTAEAYANAFSAGVRACGATAYYFDEIYKSQAYFYSLYCSLDLFVFFSFDEQTLNISFFGKYGLPVPEGTARAINNNFRFSSFNYVCEKEIVDEFRMHMLSIAYKAFLKSLVTGSIENMKLRVESDNRLLRKTMREILSELGAKESANGLQILIGANGMDMYCLENNVFYSADRIRSVLCEIAFAEKESLIIGEDAPDFLETLAERYNAQIIRTFEAEKINEYHQDVLFRSLWLFDAVILSFRLIDVLSQSSVTLKELCSLQNAFAMKNTVVEMNCTPDKIRKLIERSGAVKSGSNKRYYRYADKNGSVRMRQLGNSNKIKILAQAADMETANELAGALYAKINRTLIDKDSK